MKLRKPRKKQDALKGHQLEKITSWSHLLTQRLTPLFQVSLAVDGSGSGNTTLTRTPCCTTLEAAAGAAEWAGNIEVTTCTTRVTWPGAWSSRGAMTPRVGVGGGRRHSCRGALGTRETHHSLMRQMINSFWRQALDIEEEEEWKCLMSLVCITVCHQIYKQNIWNNRNCTCIGYIFLFSTLHCQFIKLSTFEILEIWWCQHLHKFSINMFRKIWKNLIG